MKVRRTAQRRLGAPRIARLWMPLSAGRITIFALHRFSNADLRVRGHQLSLLRELLERLRRDRFHLVSIREVLAALGDHQADPTPGVAFTVDDGYADFAASAAELFLEFDCPVTVFLTTDFIDGSWLWWDEINYICRRTDRLNLSLPLGPSMERLDLHDTRRRSAEAHRVAVKCTRVSQDEKADFILRLREAAGVAVPAQPPAEFRGMTWSEVKSLEDAGVEFGPHTVTHPCLTQTTDEQCAAEISRSWDRVASRLSRPVSALAYPNGDFGEREIHIAKEVGLAGALSMNPGYARPRGPAEADQRFRIPRYPLPEYVDQALLTVSGFDRITSGVRQLGYRWKAADVH